ncbi:MAG: alpha/beta hydrolase [Deltaproteobacteria bacterium]|jgi:pimeloyl-ACP methyl ester carboxylesterase|nr:MAG: alpha/beta hydrolase [Deltaproteobacteria bacterium]
MWIYVIGGCIVYLLLTLFFTYLVHQLPRQPVQDAPDWGKVIDTRIPASEKGSLEVWRVEPEGPSRGVVILAHGWSRNRDRMVGRARVFGKLGFTTVMHSARDHGGSSPRRFMNAPRFAEDIESVLNWVSEPVLLYGHSASAAAALITARRNPERIKLLFLEGCYARTRVALLRLYRNYNFFFGIFFAPMVVLWMDIFYKKGLDSISPVKLAPDIDLPVLLIHGSRDQNFPLHHVWKLMDSFPAGRAKLFVVRGADHSNSSLTSEYPVAIQSFLDRHLPQS